VTTIRELVDSEIPSRVLGLIRAMVVAAFDDDFSEDDWDHTRGGHRIVAFDGDDPVAHAAVVPRTLHVAARPFVTGYVEGVATRADRRHERLGTTVMRAANDVIRARCELGALSTALPGFYELVGWERWRGPSYVREGGDRVRTPDEDDGLMVLRFGPSASIELTAAIECERRSGDDW
jgi:aminoglycoside 2'-N-acetyltransferase I